MASKKTKVKGTFTFKKFSKKSSRPTLDLRARPEREVPVKQHGFKEGDIGYGNLL